MIPKDTNIYLDIDGTIIHEELWEYKKSAAYLEEFFDAIKEYPVYWLTTHCRDGNPINTQRYLQKILSAELFQYVLSYKPTTWDMKKTDGVDFSKPFIWFDNDVMQSELDDLAKNNAKDSLIKVDLVNNPNQLKEITENLFSRVIKNME